jgi:DnaJ-class molecular chaperone
MAHQNIWKICHHCHGTGKIHTVPIFDEDGNKIGEELSDCSLCEGTGRLMWGYLETE